MKSVSSRPGKRYFLSETESLNKYFEIIRFIKTVIVINCYFLSETELIKIIRALAKCITSVGHNLPLQNLSSNLVSFL